MQGLNKEQLIENFANLEKKFPDIVKILPEFVAREVGNKEEECDERQKFRHTCGTIFNYTYETIFNLFNWNAIQYCIFAFELCPTTKKPHIQYFIQYTTPTRRGQIKKKFGLFTHISITKDLTNAFQSSIKYIKGDMSCKNKDGEYKPLNNPELVFEIGVVKDPRETQGTRSDLKAFIVDAKEGMDVKKARLEYPELSAKYPNYIENVISDIFEDKNYEDFKADLAKQKLYPWHDLVLKYLSQLMSDPARERRKIYWFYSEEGNVGKTLLGDYMEVHYNAIQVDRASRGNMINYVHDKMTKSRPLILTLCRSQEEYAHEEVYAFLEQVGDGKLLNTKYKTRGPRFGVPPIFVFSNTPPLMHIKGKQTLSIDRWQIYDVADLINVLDMSLLDIVKHYMDAQHREGYGTDIFEIAYSLQRNKEVKTYKQKEAICGMQKIIRNAEKRQEENDIQEALSEFYEKGPVSIFDFGNKKCDDLGV